MKPDDTLVAWIAEADPARRAGPSALEKRELADRVRRRVLQAEHQPAERRPRPGIVSLLSATGSALLVVAVVALIVIGHHRGVPPPARQPAHLRTVNRARETFAALARPRAKRDRLPAFLRQRMIGSPGSMPKLNFARSALLISTSTHREWLVPAAGQQLCFVQLDLSRGIKPSDAGFGIGCTGRRYAELHGLELGVSTTTFNAVLPEHTTPVQVTFTDGSSIQLYANASGVITRNFSKPARLISYTGPTGLQIHLEPCTPHDQRPCLTSGSPPTG